MRKATTWDIDKINATETAAGDGAKPYQVCAVCVRADQVTTRPITWLWYQHFPRGKYCEVIGQPGLGKSLLGGDITARTSRGMAFPDEVCDHEPGDVVLLSAEDDPEDTTVPRLIAAGADLTRVHILTAVSAPDKTGVRPISLDMDIPVVERLLESLSNPKLFIVDPVTAYCGRVDSHKGAEVRALVMELSMMAQRRNICVLGITHFNKSGNGPATTRGLGSIAWTAASRMSWGVFKDTEDPACRLFLPIKCNLAADVGGLSYKIVDKAGVPVIAWNDAPVTRTVDEVLQEQQGHRSPKTSEAVDWLRNLLAAERMAASEIRAAAGANGIAERALNTAKTTLGIIPYKEGFGKDSCWYWQLPVTEE